MLRAVDSLERACQSGTYVSDDFSLDKAMLYLRIPATTNLGSGVRDALLSSGRIEALADEQLRYELAEWDSVLNELLDDQQLSAKIVLDLILPYLTRQRVPISDFVSLAVDSPSRDGSRVLSADTEAVTRLFADTEFHSIVEIRRSYMGHTTDEFDAVITAIDSILDKITASLENR